MTVYKPLQPGSLEFEFRATLSLQYQSFPVGKKILARRPLT